MRLHRLDLRRLDRFAAAYGMSDWDALDGAASLCLSAVPSRSSIKNVRDDGPLCLTFFQSVHSD
jgi:hypothetical protein